MASRTEKDYPDTNRDSVLCFGHAVKKKEKTIYGVLKDETKIIPLETRIDAIPLNEKARATPLREKSLSHLLTDGSPISLKKQIRPLRNRRRGSFSHRQME